MSIATRVTHLNRREDASGCVESSRHDHRRCQTRGIVFTQVVASTRIQGEWAPERRVCSEDNLSVCHVEGQSVGEVGRVDVHAHANQQSDDKRLVGHDIMRCKRCHAKTRASKRHRLHSGDEQTTHEDRAYLKLLTAKLIAVARSWQSLDCKR